MRYSYFEPRPIFAVERMNAEAILKALSSYRKPDEPFHLQPLSDGFRREAALGSEGRNAVFPDGLAVSFEHFRYLSDLFIAVWKRKTNSFTVFDGRSPGA